MSSLAPCALGRTVLAAGKDCPAKCQNGETDACVLYAVKSDCVSSPNTVVGNCTTEDQFPLQGPTECELTYTCPNVISVGQKAYWNFYVADRILSTLPQFAGAPIDELASLGSSSDKFASVLGFQLTGNGFTQPKGVMRTIKYPATFFGSYTQLTQLYLVNMNVSGPLGGGATGKLPPNLKSLSIANGGLATLPADIATIKTLVMLNMTDNNLVTFPSEAAGGVVSLYLAGNLLTNLTSVPPKVQTLDLSRNNFTTIPKAIFSSDVKSLLMSNNGIANVVLSEVETSFLAKLKFFDADFTAPSCPPGSGPDPSRLPNTKAQFCYAGVKGPSDESSSSLSSVAIALIVLGCVVVAAVAAFFICRRRRGTDGRGSKVGRRTSLGTAGTGDTYNHYVSADSNYRDTASLGLLSDPELLGVRIDYQEVQELQLISRGGFGEVWSGIYLGRPVAIKRLLPEKRTWDDAMNFAMEIKMMARLNHPKIVEFIGAAWSNALSIQAICEYMNCGDLKSLLDRSSKNDSGGAMLTWANIKLHLAIDVADALVYLHSLNPKFIHRDLKSRNILIDADNGAKLSDFGISRNRNLEETMTAGVGTCRWMAPEVIQGAHYDEAVDVYSFGCVLSEMDTCNVPYFDATHTNGSKLQDHAIMSGVVQGTLKPSFTKDCPKEIVAIAIACLETDPKKRPTSTQLAYLLRKYRKESERLNDTNSN
ncbi:protein kinase [Achlya hypogyna]|uniref:Protein kinase n=1 Tax=Achlya hypogyna TaxID=1202772 RepID=A0A1V9Z4I7_ACHHY|nr:protein kinase [Achlya hypogyna]